jgi:phosphate acetyltransferase
MTYFENKPFDKIKIGDTAECSHVLTRDDIAKYAEVSGDYNPYHVDDAFTRTTRFGEVVAHGMWTAGFFSLLLGTQLPGPGTIYMGQTLKFLAPVRVGDKITTTVTVRHKMARKPVVVFDCQCVNQKGRVVVTGVARVLAPTTPLRVKKIEVPEKVLSQ